MINDSLKQNLINAKKDINKCKVLCIGDIILDHYINGVVERISPEAPIPILLMQNQDYQIGGAGNVAKNISSLGGKVTLLCLTGNDTSSIIVKKLLLKEKKIKSIFIKVQNFTTPKKTRFIKEKKQLLRVDDENVNFKIKNKYLKIIIEKIEKEVIKNDIIILSDYDKGLLEKEIINKIIKISKKYDKKIIADPKKINMSVYSNIDIITPNEKEITDASKKKFLNEKNLIIYGKKIINKFQITNLLVTRSEKGMLLINKNSIKKIDACAKKIIDVTGAGDTVVATLGLMLSIGFSLNDSIKIANYAAGLVIGKNGTAHIKYSDLIK